MGADVPIFLIGPRGSGKSTVGRLLAGRLNLPFEDTDDCLQKEAGGTVSQIVERNGWEYFRQREGAVLRAATARIGVGVIATGGGMVLDPANRTFMRATGCVFYLRAPARELAVRLSEDPRETLRPCLTGLPLAAEVAKVAAERDPLYRETAHHVFDATLPPGEVCEKIVEILPDGLRRRK
ncbi:MAG: shikimate kinase AroL [Desulfovibrio sp.]|nr:shikimate kinase AroL [Desulfovibrio sp.]